MQVWAFSISIDVYPGNIVMDIQSESEKQTFVWL